MICVFRDWSNQLHGWSLRRYQLTEQNPKPQGHNVMFWPVKWKRAWELTQLASICPFTKIVHLAVVICRWKINSIQWNNWQIFHMTQIVKRYYNLRRNEPSFVIGTFFLWKVMMNQDVEWINFAIPSDLNTFIDFPKLAHVWITLTNLTWKIHRISCLFKQPVSSFQGIVTYATNDTFIFMRDSE